MLDGMIIQLVRYNFVLLLLGLWPRIFYDNIVWLEEGVPDHERSIHIVVLGMLMLVHRNNYTTNVIIM